MTDAQVGTAAPRLLPVAGLLLIVMAAVSAIARRAERLKLPDTAFSIGHANTLPRIGVL